MSLEQWHYNPSKAFANFVQFDYRESEATSNGTYSTGSSAETRVFQTSFDARLDFLDDCLGYSLIQGTSIKRVLPDRHPVVINFFASDATVEPYGTLTIESGRALWDGAKITVNYKPVPYDIKLDNVIVSELERYTERKFTPAANLITLQGTMQFVTAVPKRTIQNPPSVISAEVGLQYVWNDVPSNMSFPFLPPNLAAFNNCVGKVNSVAFDTASGFNAPAGTVLFLGMDPQLNTPRLAATGYSWTITFNFLYRNNGLAKDGNTAGHNYLYDIVAPSGWDLITSDGSSVTGTKLYQSADLNTLWTVT